ncbi:MAG: Smr/MutS family protein [Chthonomonadales bacterium]
MCGEKERDLHGLTGIQARHRLEDCWSTGKWHGLKSVQIIHGDAHVLKGVTRKWAEDKGIEWAPVSGNPGATNIFPGRRIQTKPAPPVRPLANPTMAHVRRHSPKTAVPTPSPAPPDISDDDLMKKALADLGASKNANDFDFESTGVRSLDRPELRKLLEQKVTAPAPPEPKKVTPRVTAPATPPVDPLEAEMERLANADLNALRRAKLEGK